MPLTTNANFKGALNVAFPCRAIPGLVGPRHRSAAEPVGHPPPRRGSEPPGPVSPSSPVAEPLRLCHTLGFPACTAEGQTLTLARERLGTVLSSVTGNLLP